jgi:hypothetical protein
MQLARASACNMKKLILFFDIAIRLFYNKINNTLDILSLDFLDGFFKSDNKLRLSTLETFDF